MFGLIYGTGIIEAQKSHLRLDSTEQQALHLSLSTCHAVIQETLLFFAIGAPIVWLVAPRVLISFVVVWDKGCLQSSGNLVSVRPLQYANVHEML